MRGGVDEWVGVMTKKQTKKKTHAAKTDNKWGEEKGEKQKLQTRTGSSVKCNRVVRVSC